MRYLTGLLLLAVLMAILVFALQNQRTVELRFLDNTVNFPLAGLAVVTYLLGMFSGWSLLRFFRRSVQSVHQHSASHSNI